MEIVRLGSDPGDKLRQQWVFAQRHRVRQPPGDFRLSVVSVDRGVANLVQEHCAELGAALQFWRQMMAGGFSMRRNGAAA
jgi:hypothetical protein